MSVAPRGAGLDTIPIAGEVVRETVNPSLGESINNGRTGSLYLSHFTTSINRDTGMGTSSVGSLGP
jgi:hypothetical protein